MVEHFGVDSFPSLIAVHKGKSMGAEKTLHKGAKNMQEYEKFCERFIKKPENEEEGGDKVKAQKRFSLSIPSLTAENVENVLNNKENITIIHVCEPIGLDFPALERLYSIFK